MITWRAVVPRSDESLSQCDARDQPSTPVRAGPLSAELVILGLVSAARPSTSQAAVFALLRAPAPARTLLVFTLAGLAFSVSVGILALAAFDGAGRAVGHSTLAAIVDVVAGVAALGFAAGVQRGGLGRRPPKAERGTSSLAARLRRPSTKMAAAAGVATHVPGLIYVVALNSISATQPRPAAAALDVVVYNLLWFGVPLAALAIALRSPETAVAYLDRLSAWARRNQDQLVVALFGALGVYLVVKGALELVT